MGQVNLICQYIYVHFSKPTKRDEKTQHMINPRDKTFSKVSHYTSELHFSKAIQEEKMTHNSFSGFSKFSNKVIGTNFFSDITDMEHTEWKLWQNIFKEFLPFSASVDELPFLTGDIFLAEDSSSDFSLPLEWYSSIDRQAPPTKIESQWNIKTLKCWCCLLLWVLEDFSRIMLLNILYLFRLGGWVSFHCKMFFIFFFYMAFMHSSIWVVI